MPVAPSLGYTLGQGQRTEDSEDPMVNYTIVWPPHGWTTDCLMRDRATAAYWAEQEITEAGYRPFEIIS